MGRRDASTSGRDDSGLEFSFSEDDFQAIAQKVRDSRTAPEPVTAVYTLPVTTSSAPVPPPIAKPSLIVPAPNPPAEVASVPAPAVITPPPVPPQAPAPVPVTATLQSSVFTYKWPEVRCAAFTITAP